MKKILYTTTAFILCGIAQSQAACIATPSCTTLGYTETSSCDGGLKCPFGSYWYCPSNNGSGGGLCADFPYTCFGRGYNEGEGIGADCNGKYVKCTCADGFEWKDGQGCVDITDCRIGSILYSDKSCSLSGYEAIAGTKTPIGVVVYSNEKGHGQALALKFLSTTYSWGAYDGCCRDISTLTNYVIGGEKDYDSCGNTAKILAAGDKKTYPAAWATHEYKTEGTNAGDWCLPAAGILNSYYKNQTAINTGFSRAKGTAFSVVDNTWSSTEYSGEFTWYSNFNAYNGLLAGSGYRSNKSYSNGVRPVLEF